MELAKNLNKEIFSNTVEKVPNRNGYGEGLKEAGEKNPAVVALCADLTESTRTNHFAEAYPERFVQVGIAEQNMASVASGMAAMGKVPFIASYAMFSPGRSWEQIRTTIAYNNVNVKIIGAHAGVSVGPDGATHQAIEDIALMRVIPNMIVLAPCDVHEAKRMTLWAAEHVGPVYIRIAREKTPVVTTNDTVFEFGKLMSVIETDDKPRVTLISTGTLLHEAVLAGKSLNQEGIATKVLHMGTIKPLDTAGLLKVAQESDLVVTIEEHQIAGGMGSAVSEFLSAEYPTKILRVGVDDQFGQSGKPEELIARYGMDAASIVNRVKHVL